MQEDINNNMDQKPLGSLQPKAETQYIDLYDYDKVSNSATYKATSTARAINNATHDRMVLPYPESETVQNPLLKQAPVNYVFTEARITDLFN